MQVDDAEDLHAAFSDPEVMRYFDDPHRTLAKTQAWVRRSVSAPSETTREYVIVRDGKVIGKAGIWKAPEIGFLLRRDQWRKGIAFEALTGLIPHVAIAMNLKEITADVDPRNDPSLALLDRLGFVRTGVARDTIKIGGLWCDSVYLERSMPPDRKISGI